MSRVDHLPTLGDQQAKPRAKWKTSTRLARAIAKKAARLDDAKKLTAWAKAVKERDCWKDRRTEVRVRSTRDLDPLRAEAHHIVPKEDRAVRYDVRNGICLSFETHDLVERYQSYYHHRVRFRNHKLTIAALQRMVHAWNVPNVRPFSGRSLTARCRSGPSPRKPRSRNRSSARS